ncbi:MAG: hypothetical protein ACFE9Q_11425 [Candidatus Hodarchaeota archaeon]
MKIFKITHRWRYSFSNQSLDHFYFPKAHENLKNQLVLSKKWSLTRNSSLNVNNYPLILIIRMNYKRTFQRILTEGLCSYGINVINIRAKIKKSSMKVVTEKELRDEWNSLISTVIGFFEDKELIMNSNYVVLNYSKSYLSYKAIISDKNNNGVILINPKLNKHNLKNFFDIVEEFYTDSRIYIIFSRKSILLLKNRNLKKFLKEFYPQNANVLKFSTINKAKNSFKFYETIVLGLLIDIIENKLSNSKI